MRGGRQRGERMETERGGEGGRKGDRGGEGGIELSL